MAISIESRQHHYLQLHGYGQFRSAVGWTISEFTKALNKDPTVMFL